MHAGVCPVAVNALREWGWTAAGHTLTNMGGAGTVVGMGGDTDASRLSKYVIGAMPEDFQVTDITDITDIVHTVHT